MTTDWLNIHELFQLTLTLDIAHDDECPNRDTIEEAVRQGIRTGYMAEDYEFLSFRASMLEIIAGPGLYRETFLCELEIQALWFGGDFDDFARSVIVSAANDGFGAAIARITRGSLWRNGHRVQRSIPAGARL